MAKEGAGGANQKRLWEITRILRRHNIAAGIPPEKLVSILEDLGPTFIKLGQIMSMQPILPVEYCHELGHLRAQATPMEFGEVESILEDEYGPDWREIFLKIDEPPLGSASIAQVHSATLADGSSVVVKIQRRGIYETMASDLSMLRKAAKILKYTPIGHTVDFEMVLDEMWTITKQEMDFLREAENAAQFAKNNAGVSYVACPEIISRYSTSRVLVMEHIKGPYIDNLEQLAEMGYDLHEIAAKLANNFVKQIVEDGFFHGDPHCGNIIIREGKIVWIDLGMMGRLSARDQKLLLEAAAAVADNDIAKLTDFVLSIGRYQGKIDEAALYQDLKGMLRKFGSVDFASLDLTQVSEAFLSLLGTHGISIPKGVSMLGRSMATMQGTLRTVDDQINLVEVLASYMSGHYLVALRKELTTTLKSVRASLKKSLDIPAGLSDTLRSISAGSVRVNMDMAMSDDMSKKIDKMLNKLVVSIITAALLVGSCLICTTDMRPKILGIPAIGFLGFGTSIMLAGWLLLSPFRKKKR